MNDTFTYKDVCSKPVTIHTKGHERVLLVEHGDVKPVKDPKWVPKGGDRFINQSPDETIYVYRPGHKKDGEFRRIGGSFYNKVSKDGDDLKVIGVGENLLYGPGVRGLRWVDGVQKFWVSDFLEETAKIHDLRVHGDTDELCGDLGLKPADR